MIAFLSITLTLRTMCGIAGIIAWDDRYHITRDVLEKMSARIAHRGPDGQGLYLNHEQEARNEGPQVGLIHRRLAILDLDPRSNQPFADEGGRRLIFNGEIFNYRELRQELKALRPDYVWRTDGDTEVLLQAYAAWGEKCVDHLNGMFAFAVWDEPRQQLYLARDRIGQKPLYVSYLQVDEKYPSSLNPQQVPGFPRVVAFGSELGALRELTYVDASLNETSLGMYLALGYIPEGSIYHGVAKLQPGHWALISAAGCAITKYTSREDVDHRHLTDDYAVVSTRAMLTKAVGRQLVSDVPLGCFLSGGVDSSIIAAVMKGLVPRGQPVHTFSIGFSDPRYDETAYAAQVAAHLGTEHHAFIAQPDLANDLPALARVFGEPFGDSSALATHYLARETRGLVKVALSGDGGDELFGGYDRYRAMLASQKLRWMPRWLTHAAIATLPGSHPKNRFARIKRLLRGVHLPADERYASYIRLFSQAMLDEMVLPTASNHVRRQNFPSPLFGVINAVRDVVQAARLVDLYTYLPEDVLTKVDRASMLHALEVRSPFLDPQVVNHGIGLSTDQLLRGGPKRMLREAFAADLPASVFKRKKMGFAVPIGEWFRGELRSMLRDHLFAADSLASQYFARPIVERLLEEHESQRDDHSQRLYAMLMLELWWKTQK